METTRAIAFHAGESLGWFSRLDRQARNTFYATFAGWMIDAFDFIVFSFVISFLVAHFGIQRGAAGLLGTVTLLASAVGGWGAGMLADAYGRVRVLQATILWFSACTVAIGFANDFITMLVLRFLQGLGFGGEWAVGAVLMAEITCARDRGKVVGFVQSGFAVGWGIAAVAYSIAFSVLPAAMAWRALFWSGLIPTLIVLFIRRNLKEPEIFVRTKAQERESGVHANPLGIFSPPMLRTTALASLLCSALLGGYYAMSIWLPTFLSAERHLSVLNTSGYLLVLIFGSFFGCIGGAYLVDVWGRKTNLIVFSVLASASMFAYLTLPLSDHTMLFLGFPLGLASCGVFGGIGVFLTELYPSSVRASGQSFCYNFGRAIGAVFPVLVGYLSQATSLGTAIAVFAGTAYAGSVMLALLLPETKGRALA